VQGRAAVEVCCVNVGSVSRSANGQLPHDRERLPCLAGCNREEFLRSHRPAAIGVTIGGWHDFRHTLNRMARRNNVHPVVISGVLGHKKVELAPEVYDRASSADIRDALILVGKRLLPTMLPTDSVN
jgi:hypothetical protein